jgi:hypothetical protein
MSGLEMLDVLIGLITIYMVMGIACTAIIEAISAWLKVRSGNLQTALQSMLSGTDTEGTAFLTKFNNHPLIRSLSKNPAKKPSYSYLSGETVGQVVEDVVLGADTNIRSALDKLPDNSQVKALLASLWRHAEQDSAKFRQAITKHFDNIMERSSGWYKRFTQKWSILIAAALVIGANVDTIDLYRNLSDDPALRARVETIAQNAVAKTNTDTAAGADKNQTTGNPPVKDALKQTTSAVTTVQGAVSDFGLGWNILPTSPGAWVSKIIGLLISTFAVSLGAPFWFDLLQRFMKVRTSIAANEEKKKAKKGKGTGKENKESEVDS